MEFKNVTYLTGNKKAQTGIFELDFREEFKNYNITPTTPDSYLFEPAANSISATSKRKTSKQSYQKHNIGKFLKEQITPTFLTSLVSSNPESTSFFNTQWPLPSCTQPEIESFISKTVKISSEILLDKSTMGMTRHVDNRFVFGILILNLKDNTNSTQFFKRYQEKEAPAYTAPSTFGTGVFFLNSEHSTHSIDVTEENRIISYTMCRLDIY